MEQQDYLQRLIEQLGNIFRKIYNNLLGLKNQEQLENGIEIADQTLKKELDLSVKEIINIPNENFIKTFTEKKEFNNKNINTFANILLYIAENGIGKEQLYEKCLILYEYLKTTENIYSMVRQGKITRIKKYRDKFLN